MKEKQNRRHYLRPYWQAMPDLFKYQIAVGVLLGAILFVLRILSILMLRSTGRVAVSSGDFMFLFTSWQGIALILFGITVLFLYLAFDINTKLVFARNLIEGQPDRMRESIREGLFSVRSFLCPEGFWIVLYIALLAPLVGVGVSMALTENLYIPTFITSVIETTPLYLALYTVAMTMFAFIGIMNLFCLHGVIIDKFSVKESVKRSRELMKKNRRNYLWNTIRFAVGLFLVNAVLVVLCIVVGVFIIALAQPVGESAMRFWLLFTLAAGASVVTFFNSFSTSFCLLRTTQLYYRYCGKEITEFPNHRSRSNPFVLAILALALILIVGGSKIGAEHFDVLFPNESHVGVIAHRGGGSEGPENTVAGIDIIAQSGVYGSEIDIQRTADGQYIINHDTTFARLTGVNKKPGEMTLEEIRRLVIQDPNHPGSTAGVATFEEMLDASKDRLILFVELKGDSADTQMVDDAVKMIEERGMRDQCVLISLKYDLIDYAETKYPQMQTGYLTFFSFGNTAQLNCDFIGLEEESATSSAIEQIHGQGKKALVWTPNEAKSQKHFLLSEVDGIITDNVFQAKELQKKLSERTDIERIIDKILG